MPATDYIEFLDITDLSDGSADLSGLLADLGEALIDVRPGTSANGSPAYEVDFDHRALRNTHAHGAMVRRGFHGCVNYRRSA